MALPPIGPTRVLLGLTLALAACASRTKPAPPVQADGGARERADSARSPAPPADAGGAEAPPEEPPAEEENEDEDKPEVNREPCQVNGRELTLVTASSSICDGLECNHSESITVEDKDGTALLAASNEHVSYRSAKENTDEEDDVTVWCDEEGRLQVGGPDHSPVVALSYHPKRRRLELSAAVQALGRGWPAPAKDIEVTLTRVRAASVLEVLLAGQEREDKPPRAIGGLDRTFVRSLLLLAAHDHIAAGSWGSGESLLQELTDTPEKPLPAALKKRRAQLLAAVGDARASTLPVKVLERRRLGTTLVSPYLPTHAGERATMFWAGAELCVVQEEQPPKTMRCYASDRKAWNAARPIALPDSGGHQLKVISPSECEGSFAMQAQLKDSNDDPCDGPGEKVDDLLAVVDRNVMLVADGPEFAPFLDEDGTNTPLDLAQISATVARSAGGLVLGNGCCRFYPDGRLGRLGTDGEQQWDLRGPPPANEHWIGVPLVSPDQRWVVLQSQPEAGRVTLWLLRLSPPG